MIYALNFKVIKSFSLADLGIHSSWVVNVFYIPEHHKHIIVSDDRKLILYDLMTIKPRIVYGVQDLGDNPLCSTFVPEYEENQCAILFGDDGGYINSVLIPKQFWSENSTEITPYEITNPERLTNRNLNRNNCLLVRVSFDSILILY